MHVTACAAERNWSAWGHVYTKARNRMGLTLGEMIVFIKGNSKAAAGQDEEWCCVVCLRWNRQRLLLRVQLLRVQRLLSWPNLLCCRYA
jgi:hypothetical protein